MVCPNCGAPNSEQVTTCKECGRGLLAVDEGQTVYLDENPSSIQPSVAKSASASAAQGVITPPPPDPAPQMTWGSLPSAAVALPSSILPGTTFGRYRIESLLGEGGMGAVYRATDTELDRIVALKLVRPELAINPQTMKRFKQELLLASRISHKNILRIHDLGDSQGIKFITMAFVEGMDLAGLIDKVGRLPFDRALKFTRQLFSALEAAHAEGVVHRDLKPQNILVDASDNIYVSDFGLAKSLEAEYSMGTRTGQILGTPRYMSPEQVEAREVDHRSDLYSAGLIVYEMFTAELPFRGESAMQLMYQRVSEPPKDPRSVVPDLPDYIAHLILRCLAKDPDKRYQSASEVLKDLDAMQAPAPAPVRDKVGAQTISIQIPKPTRRGGLVAAAVFAVLAATLGSIPATRNAIKSALGLTAKEAGNRIDHRLAVLPLNVGDAADLKYLADGVGEALTAKLSGLRNVYVADSATITPALLKLDDAKLAYTLGVKILVKGSLQVSGDRIQILLKVEDTEKKLPPFNKEFAGVRNDLLTLEDEVFDALAAALVIKQTSEERARITARPTQIFGAYELYLKGVSVLRGKRDAATAQEALGLFQSATAADPGFALAYTGIADASMKMYLATKDRQWTQRALGAAQQAEQLKSNLPEAHFSLGVIYSTIGRTEEAIAELQLALQSAPNSDEGLRRLGLAYKNAGKLELAAAAYAKAAAVNPYNWRNHDLLGATYFRLGQNAKALAAHEEEIKLAPNNSRGWSGKGAALYRLGDPKAVEAFQKAIELEPEQPLYYSQLGTAYFFLGRYAEAANTFEKGLKKAPDDAVLVQYLADAYKWSGRSDKAQETYSKAIDLAYQDLKANPKSKDALAVLGVSYAKKGDAAQALEFIRQARQIDQQDNDLMYKETVVHSLAGRLAEASASLKQALQNGYYIKEAKADPELKALRDRPEFPAILRDAEQTNVNK